MVSPINSWDDGYAANSVKQPLARKIKTSATAPTAATTASGYASCARCVHSFTVPSFGAGITNVYMTHFRGWTSGNNTLILAAIDVTLRTIAIASGTNTPGSSMPTRTVAGSSLQTASCIPLLHVSSALTATTPTIGYTYTDQDGNASQSAGTITLPSNAGLNSCFLVAPHLANGDTGVQAVSALTKSAGSAGTLVARGLLPVGFGACAQGGVCGNIDPLGLPWPMFPIQAGDVLGFYVFGIAAGLDVEIDFALEAEY
ncbi:MAG: hypothetical protein K2X91_00455 [Thermoleophilia bacterium]|nr:hypothetical protein [Thermoleophilia bacterium]